MTIKAKPLPTVTSTVAPDLRRFIDRLRETFDDPNGLVTKTELIGTGAFKVAAGPVLKYEPPTLEPPEVYFTPPAPRNLVATGAMTSITLTWSGVNYNSGYAYTEVWRASTDDLGLAVLIGTTTSGMYADAVGSDASHYYWVRMVNVANEKGPFNASRGVAGATAPDLEYVFSQLTSAYGTTSDAPFFQLDSDTTINGVTVPAGTYIKEAKIHNGEITNAKIGALAVDAAKIANATIVNAKIADGTIETAKIKDANITTAKIANAAITNAKINDLNASKINAGTISADRIGAGTITADKVTLSPQDVGAGAASGNDSLRISSSKIEIYNSGTLRVKIGDLS
jgi:hypothetical protein